MDCYCRLAKAGFLGLRSSPELKLGASEEEVLFHRNEIAIFWSILPLFESFDHAGMEWFWIIYLDEIRAVVRWSYTCRIILTASIPAHSGVMSSFAVYSSAFDVWYCAVSTLCLLTFYFIRRSSHAYTFRDFCFLVSFLGIDANKSGKDADWIEKIIFFNIY